tara:strand:+ start:111 stop:353 length:243 start_codon:yes stop_codon:yes gene_type:complete
VVGLKDEKIILRIARDATNEMVVRTGNFYNIDIVDIRWHVNSQPTKKGIRMNMKEMEDVHKALEKILRNRNEHDNNEQDV